MSVLGKKWIIKNEDNDQNTIQKILRNRGLDDPELAKTFLESNFKKGFHNPFLMKDMGKAVDRIKKAVAKNERIMIFGDYDVDGISGTAILMHTLKQIGARVSYRLPHRVEDGYGLSEKFIHEFAGLEVKLIVTVDCGISCEKQIAIAAEYGIDVIVTDHHSIPENIPDKAYAILHPLQQNCEYPFKGLTGAGVAFKLASALVTDHFIGEERDNYLYSLLDLASLGTVADIGPLTDENRIIVKYGLDALQKTKWLGLSYLKQYCGIHENEKLDIKVLGFQLGPRINAAGRIDHPYYALQLLLHDKADEKGKLLAEHLEKLNQKRQQMVFEALEGLENYFITQKDAPKIFIAWNKDWHVGILGLLANKVAERYNAPAIILQDFGEHCVASARGPEHFNIVEALREHGHLLENFGGHAQAAGFTIKKDNLEEFKTAMEEYARAKLEQHIVRQDLFIDCELLESDINVQLLKVLELLSPYGVGNEQPLFLLKNIAPSFIKKVGKEQKHIHFRAQLPERHFPVIGFKLGMFEPYLLKHQKIDLVCYLEENRWKGEKYLQLRAVDLRRSE